MEKFVPFEKLSKKEKRKQNRARRNGWGALSPVTRKPAFCFLGAYLSR